MYKYIIYLAALIVISLNSTVFAVSPQPEKCPSVAQIKSMGITYSYLSSKGYVVSQLNNYDTNTLWVFAIGFIKALSSEEALTRGRFFLSLLNKSPELIQDHADGGWGCLYFNKGGISAIALTTTNQDILFQKSYMSLIFNQ